MTELRGAHREALIEATVAEFAAVGYERASLNRIIRSAGISKSSFYNAVGSKGELFDAVVRMLVDDVRAQWTPPAPAEFAAPDFWERVDAVLAAFAELGRGRALPLLGRIFYLPATGAADGRADLLAAVGAWVTAVISAGRAAGAVRDDMPIDLQAAAAFGMLRGVDEWALGAGPLAPAGASRPLGVDETSRYPRESDGVSSGTRGLDGDAAVGHGAEILGGVEREAAAPGILLRRLLGT
ncbi:TetR/AcrR family transcriptional regulator [Microbacterium sp. CIAB417]|uniref:TetR/AcrR family transcriptional regulator n=1 Tax=Microbacterium sp. CIAB417 TaxID=2860287 RepID=UPI001FABDC4A|nr:TetR/AcrR family transcriptional regulator [Microbacterium sp. CIAB417]